MDGRSCPKRTDNRGLAGMSKEKRVEIAKKGSQASIQAREQKRTLAYMFKEAMTPEKNKTIVDSFLFVVTNGNARVSDRVKVLELILRLTGELPGGASKTEIEALGDIVLKID